ncbi:four-helix bundle copper-binding protein [Spirosoma arcticum]
MIWKKNIYDSLISCANLCDEFAADCFRSEDVESQYCSLFLSLDCADICRQLAMLYVRDSENILLLAKACVEVCEKCAQQANTLDTQRCQHVYASCQQTISSCVSILNMAHHTDASSTSALTSTSLFSGVDLRKTFYN